MNVQAVALDGLRRAEARVESAASRLAHSSDPNEQVDLATGMIALMEGQNAYAVNTKVLKTADQMEKHLIDILA